MKFCSKATIVFFAVCVLGIMLSAPSPMAQTRDQGPWWPHPEWGPDDQAGSSNRITPEKILEAASLVRTGKVYELGHVTCGNIALSTTAHPILGRADIAKAGWNFPALAAITKQDLANCGIEHVNWFVRIRFREVGDLTPQHVLIAGAALADPQFQCVSDNRNLA